MEYYQTARNRVVRNINRRKLRRERRDEDIEKKQDKAAHRRNTLRDKRPKYNKPAPDWSDA